MAVIETTSGDKIIIIPNCDCGLTGGCAKCQPIFIPRYPSVILIKPSRYEEYVSYRKAEIVVHLEWGIRQI